MGEAASAGLRDPPADELRPHYPSVGGEQLDHRRQLNDVINQKPTNQTLFVYDSGVRKIMRFARFLTGRRRRTQTVNSWPEIKAALGKLAIEMKLRKQAHVEQAKIKTQTILNPKLYVNLAVDLNQFGFDAKHNKLIAWEERKHSTKLVTFNLETRAKACPVACQGNPSSSFAGTVRCGRRESKGTEASWCDRCR